MSYKHQDEARDALLKAIVELAPKMGSAGSIRDLAEAYAWAVSPGQPHGGHTTNK
ncbi:hypothetical protein ACIA49_03510 [Kribbella sp. NPDC051587]|uniref:hypothetical protein n=1 Tax=Kribbella sp. NPDC051587 TaxID=3364119 RepID=UPI0037BE1658